MMLLPSLDAGQRRHRLLLQNPGAAVPDGDGGFTQAWTDLAPPLYAAIDPATAGTLERFAAGTVTAIATHVMRLPWRAGITTKTRVLLPAPAAASRPDDPDWTGRAFSVTGVANLEERAIELVIACAEVVP